jgi:hypothetical protein
MPEPVGKIIRMKNRFPGPATLAVNTIGEGLRRHLNMCFCCDQFHPDDPETHCGIAGELFDLCKTHGLGTILVRCPQFTPNSRVQVDDVREPRQ